MPAVGSDKLQGRQQRYTITLYNTTLSAQENRRLEIQGELQLQCGRLSEEYSNPLLGSFVQMTLRDPDGRIEQFLTFPDDAEKTRRVEIESGDGSFHWTGNVRRDLLYDRVNPDASARLEPLYAYDRLTALTDPGPQNINGQPVAATIAETLQPATDLDVYVQFPLSVALPDSPTTGFNYTEITNLEDIAWQNDWNLSGGERLTDEETLRASLEAFGMQVAQSWQEDRWIAQHPLTAGAAGTYEEVLSISAPDTAERVLPERAVSLTESSNRLRNRSEDRFKNVLNPDTVRIQDPPSEIARDPAFDDFSNGYPLQWHSQGDLAEVSGGVDIGVTGDSASAEVKQYLHRYLPANAKNASINFDASPQGGLFSDSDVFLEWELIFEADGEKWWFDASSSSWDTSATTNDQTSTNETTPNFPKIGGGSLRLEIVGSEVRVTNLSAQLFSGANTLPYWDFFTAAGEDILTVDSLREMEVQGLPYSTTVPGWFDRATGDHYAHLATWRAIDERRRRREMQFLETKLFPGVLGPESVLKLPGRQFFAGTGRQLDLRDSIMTLSDTEVPT